MMSDEERRNEGRRGGRAMGARDEGRRSGEEAKVWKVLFCGGRKWRKKRSVVKTKHIVFSVNVSRTPIEVCTVVHAA